ncbi:MAG: cadmium-translocating P-type ATPase [Oscillospiraceae bacterium]|nr:cadmium-translocating P-type ATPase [Oscillospiraceae bacterium]
MSKKQKKMLIRIIAAGVIWAIGFAVEHIFPTDDRFSLPGFVHLGIFTAAYLVIGWDILWKAIRNIAHGQVFDENFLMCIASIGAMVIGEYDEGGAVMILYQIGELFQSVAVGKSRRSIAEMVDINPEYANVERNGEVSEVSPEDVAAGETIVIRPGERIPLDGTVISGSSELNTAALTGESALRAVAEGDEVISGCINTNGLLKVKVSRPYSDSTVARILELVENSTENKAKPENFITKFAKIYTPVVVFAAVALAIIPGLIQTAMNGFTDFTNWTGEGGWVYRALSFLVVSCPCALVISVPLSYFGGIGGASKYGIMIKGANYLEELSRARTFVFDKTGTLTKGSFAVTGVSPVGISENELLGICAAAETYSTHPIAQSIIAEAKKRELTTAASDAEEIAGYGVKAVVDGKTAIVGNHRLMQRENIEAPSVDTPGTVVHCAVDGKYAGYIIISDEIKPGSAKALAALKELCGAKTVMLTGDRKAAADAIAKDAGIDEYHAELLPDGKVAKVEELYKAKPENSSLVFVGDGMNDAPALARADVGIAMGAMGSDAAIEAADIVLMNDNIESLPTAVRISKKTHAIVMQNIVFAIGVKVLIMLLTAIGIGNMWIAVFGDVGVAVLAILNAMRAMRIK